LYNVGATASTEIHRIFDVGGKDIDKIRHGIMPELTYSYIPNVSQTDLPDFATAIPEQNTLTYSLTNTLLAKLNEKDGGKSYREFLRFKLAQTYDFKEARRGDVDPPKDRRPFSDINMELDVKPLQYLSFMARNIYSVNSGEWLQTNYDLNISDWRGDEATVGYRSTKNVVTVVYPTTPTMTFTSFQYSQPAGEEINLSLKAAVTKSIDLLYILRKNQLDDTIVERTYGLKYRKQCWSIEVYISETQNDRTFMVGVSLVGLGKYGGK
jgi:LPS-assembly protein